MPSTRSRFKVCAEHRTYVAGCRACQAGARLKNRAYMSVAANRDRKNRRQLGRDSSTDASRSPESSARARSLVRAKYGRISTARARTRLSSEDLSLIFSDMSAVAVAALVERSPQAIYHMRSKRHANPDYVPRGTPGRGLLWTSEEDGWLAANAHLSNKALAESLGRSYEAVKFRKSFLRRRAAKQGGSA